MNNSKPNLLIVTQWYRPAYKAGGPVTSVFNLVEQLKHCAHITVLCGGYDLGETEPLAVNLDHDVNMDGIIVVYTSSLKSTLVWFKKLTKSEGLSSVYFNDFYSLRYFILPRLILGFLRVKARPVLALRGMLLPGAMTLKSNKKRIYVRLMRMYLGVFKTQLHFTSTHEEVSSQKLLGKRTHFVTLPNLPAPKVTISHLVKERGKLILGYFGRISAVKNLALVIDAINELEINYDQLELHVWGNIEDQIYFKAINDRITEVPQAEVKFHGAFLPDQISSYMKKIHVVVCPSFSENYGHAMVQALCHAVPVIATKHAPWQKLEAHDAGVLIDPYSTKTCVQGIQYFLDMDQSTYSQVCGNSEKFAEKEILRSGDVQQYKALLLN